MAYCYNGTKHSAGYEATFELLTTITVKITTAHILKATASPVVDMVGVTNVALVCNYVGS